MPCHVLQNAQLQSPRARLKSNITSSSCCNASRCVLYPEALSFFRILIVTILLRTSRIPIIAVIFAIIVIAIAVRLVPVRFELQTFLLCYSLCGDNLGETFQSWCL